MMMLKGHYGCRSLEKAGSKNFVRKIVTGNFAHLQTTLRYNLYVFLFYFTRYRTCVGYSTSLSVACVGCKGKTE